MANSQEQKVQLGDDEDMDPTVSHILCPAGKKYFYGDFIPMLPCELPLFTYFSSS